MEKKIWLKPQLLVLGRATPEESVLNFCKGLRGTTSPKAGNSKCEETKQDYCADCKAYAAS